MKWFKKKYKLKKITKGRAQLNINRKSFIVHHYCPHTYNAGDHFVIRSIRKHLSEYLPEAVYFPKPCAHNRGWNNPVRLVGRNVDFSNEFADAVIIGGSDQYNNWSLRLVPEEMRQLIPPLYLIGLGVSSKTLDGPVHIEKKSYLTDIRIANEIARYSSVRDNFTKQFLADLGYSDAVVTGCPAMHLFNEKFKMEPGGIAALTFPFPIVRKKNAEAYDHLVDTMKWVYTKVESLGYQPVIVCHDDRDIPAAQTLFPEARLYFSNYVDEFIEFYQSVSLVLGSRLHACILAAGMGKPFVNINLDLRGKAFSDTFGLNDWNVDITDSDLLSKLEDRIVRLHQNDLSELNDFYKTKSEYRQGFLAFMKEVAEDIRIRDKK